MSMAKIVFKFFEVIVKDDDIVTFVNKMEEILKEFAGGAYHFRYYIEEPPDRTHPKPQEEWLKRP